MIRTIRNSFRRKKKPKVPESTQPPEWQQDESSVKTGSCKFHVKYLGCIEVQDSRGMQVCEQAVKQLKAGKKKKIKAILYVSPEALRVVEDSSKALLLDQTIEKVSFCAPDRNYNRAFSYICRDGTTRRWICHSFFAIKDSGERLSHAVGCAFAACLEKKQKREREALGVTARYDNNRTMFTREGSFRPKMLTELENENEASNTSKEVSQISADIHTSTAAVPRPHAPLHLVRQASLRNFSNKKKFMDGDLNSPFKRNLSLRVNELPSTISRQQVMNPVPEDEMESEINSQVSHSSTFDDPFTKAPPITKPILAVRPTNINGFGDGSMNGFQPFSTPSNDMKPLHLSSPSTASPVHETNPWASEVTQQPLQSHKRTPSQADQWLSGLESQAKSQKQQQQHQVYMPAPPVQNYSSMGVMPPQQMNSFQQQQQQFQPMMYNQYSVQQPQTFAMVPGVNQTAYHQQNAFMVNL